MIKKIVTNKELMERVKRSDYKAYKLLYERLWESLYIKAFSMLGDKDLAKDIIQNVWISFWERRLEIKNDNIEGYLMNAVRFKIYNEFRNLKYQHNLMQEFVYQLKSTPVTNNVEDLINFNATKKQIDVIVNRLPKRCKEVFELSRYEGMRNNEIAKKLNISQRTVETHISNALKILKSNLALSLLLLFDLI